jgi:hypothetical protein
MKTYLHLFPMAILSLALSATVGLARAQESRVGGYAEADVSEKEVVAAAAFAVKAQADALREKPDAPPVKLELVRIVRAEQQVVAGMNFRLRLKVRHDGREKLAEAVVWWQAWRKPDPHELTSWRWL